MSSCLYSLISYSEYRLECKPGRLLLFKSSLEHGTPKQKNGEKIVVSFNINIWGENNEWQNS